MVHAVLANPATDPASAHFQFAAKTLHDKICCDFDDLPLPQRLALREAISAHVLQWGLRPGVPRPVLRRLAMCAAALAVQMEWAEVFGYVVSLSGRAPPGHEPQTARLVLELLAALPDQCHDLGLRCSDHTRDTFQTLLDRNQPDVFAFLAASAQRPEVASNADAATALLRCFADWVRFCRVGPSALASHPILPAALATLASASSAVPEPVLEATVDLIVEVLRK